MWFWFIFIASATMSTYILQSILKESDTNDPLVDVVHKKVDKIYQKIEGISWHKWLLYLLLLGSIISLIGVLFQYRHTTFAPLFLLAILFCLGYSLFTAFYPLVKRDKLRDLSLSHWSQLLVTLLIWFVIAPFAIANTAAPFFAKLGSHVRLTLTDHTIINTRDSLNIYYLGKTSTHLFLYNTKDSVTSIVPTSQIAKIDILK